LPGVQQRISGFGAAPRLLDLFEQAFDNRAASAERSSRVAKQSQSALLLATVQQRIFRVGAARRTLVRPQALNAMPRFYKTNPFARALAKRSAAHRPTWRSTAPARLIEQAFDNRAASAERNSRFAKQSQSTLLRATVQHCMFRVGTPQRPLDCSNRSSTVRQQAPDAVPRFRKQTHSTLPLPSLQQHISQLRRDALD
jgi:Spy/CpxP family protein refolding chaperone